MYRQPGNFIDQFGRSLSSNPVTVAKLGAAYAAAEQRAGVAATVKHFPGLGAAAQPQNTDIKPVTIQLPAATALRPFGPGVAQPRGVQGRGCPDPGVARHPSTPGRCWLTVAIPPGGPMISGPGCR